VLKNIERNKTDCLQIGEVKCIVQNARLNTEKASQSAQNAR